MDARPVNSVVVVVRYLYGCQEYHLIDRAVIRSKENKQYNSSFSWENYRMLRTWTLITVTRISLQPEVHWPSNNKQVMDFAARMIMSLWIISACILRGVGVASNDDNYCESDFPNLHAPCLQQQPTLGVPLTTARASRTAKILMPTDLANSLPPKNFSLKSLDHSVSIGGKITTDYFTVEEAKRWNVSLSFSTLPNELKHITLVQLTYTVVNFTGVDEFLSTIHIHVGDTFYEWQFLLFHKQNLTSSEGTSTTPVIPTESEGEAGKPYPNPFILSISVNVVLLIPIIIWICFPHQTERWRSQNCLLRRIESAIHGTQSVDSSSPHLIKYTNIPQRDSSSPGEASTGKCNSILV